MSDDLRAAAEGLLRLCAIRDSSPDVYSRSCLFQDRYREYQVRLAIALGFSKEAAEDAYRKPGDYVRSVHAKAEIERLQAVIRDLKRFVKDAGSG